MTYFLKSIHARKKPEFFKLKLHNCMLTCKGLSLSQSANELSINICAILGPCSVPISFVSVNAFINYG